MQILQNASVDLRQRLLELFPIATLRATFSPKGSKERISRTLASDTKQLATIAAFVDENLPFCKQDCPARFPMMEMPCHAIRDSSGVNW